MSGISAGILGIEGLYGILFYFLMFFIVSGCILAKAKFNIPNYFRNSNDVVYGGWTNDLMVFFIELLLKNYNYLALYNAMGHFT